MIVHPPGEKEEGYEIQERIRRGERFSGPVNREQNDGGGAR